MSGLSGPSTKVIGASPSAGNAASIAERKKASFGAAITTKRFCDAVVACEVVGDAERGVDAAVERAVDVGDEPVQRPDRLGPAAAARTRADRSSAASARQTSASQYDSASSARWRNTVKFRPSTDSTLASGGGSFAGAQRRAPGREREVRREVRDRRRAATSGTASSWRRSPRPGRRSRASPTRGGARRRRGCRRCAARGAARRGRARRRCRRARSARRSRRPPRTPSGATATHAAVTASRLRYQSVWPRRESSPGRMPAKRWSANPFMPTTTPPCWMRPSLVDELDADGADLGPGDPADQLVQPSRIGELGVVVEEHEHVALRAGRGRGVVHRGVVEGLVPPEHVEVEAPVAPASYQASRSSVRPPLSTISTSNVRVVGAQPGSAGSARASVGCGGSG